MLEGPRADGPPGGRDDREHPDEAPEDLLRQDPRSRLLMIIRKTPGRTLVDLLHEADMTTGSFHHHLGQLQDAGLVTLRTVDDATRAYPADPGSP